jgi:drug/metabolite transporter (DMT)-like permease
MKVFFYTGFALVCFALNSILCRLALGQNLIDAPSFMTIRIGSGAITLLLIVSFFKNKNAEGIKGNWLSAFFLFAYAICFSFAYNELTTATGALILFGTVQATMIILALIKGERPNTFEWFGLLVAVGGLIYLVSPGLSAPPVFSACLMACAGIAWGFYTLRGKGSANPLADTTGNFLRAVPFVVISALPFIRQTHFSTNGILYAVLSGAIASGIGYAVWYAALKFHTATRAAVLQLSVPIIAAIGGILLLSESVSMRLLISAILILGGIGAVILSKRKA